jgi:hypothetical protein
VRLALVAAVAVAVAACTPGGTSDRSAPQGTPEPSPSRGHAAHADDDTDADVPLRPGERFRTVRMPRAYEPAAPTYGTDDYRCFLLDPGLAQDGFVTGIDVVPGAADLVHHVILFRVPPDLVGTARRIDRSDDGQGWTCFGGSGLEGADASLDSAPWLGAWAPGGGERLMAPDIGIPLDRGSRIVMQVHYNLLDGTGEDRSAARLRLAGGGRELTPLDTVLVPAPVELPCRPGTQEPLCDREAALRDLVGRFGKQAAGTVAGLQLVCNGIGGPDPGTTQSCARRIEVPTTVRAVGGHMHLLGRTIRITANPGRPDERTLLDIDPWDFDDQGTTALRRPERLVPGDELEVTCTHDQGLRDLLPAFEGQPERYVLWGEGTTDEMCLGIALVTRP